MTRNELRSILGPSFSTFIEHGNTQQLVDSYDELGLHLHYDESDALEFIECFALTNVTYQESALIGRPFVEIVDELRKSNITEHTNFFGSHVFWQVGIALGVPADHVESVGVSRRGYYDDLEV